MCFPILIDTAFISVTISDIDNGFLFVPTVIIGSRFYLRLCLSVQLDASACCPSEVVLHLTL